jgi:uncharacterized protein with ParB-like and HNH nuclease domain
MDVTEASFNDIISPSGIQYVIPVWQRLYSWGDKEWTDLWEDIDLLCERIKKGESAQHFLGPMVVKTVEEKVGEITRRLVIDGQQRITTLLVICALLRDCAKEKKEKTTAGAIDDFILRNKYAKSPQDELKLRPTAADRVTFEKILNGKYAKDEEDGSQIGAAYEFFSSAVRSHKKYSIDELLTAVKSLKIVTIRLRDQDDPNRIFETLNFRGRELTQSDLIRNYFMMAIRDEKKAEQAYANLWLPMQRGLGSDTPERMENLENFLRHFVVMNDHQFVKRDQVYIQVREQLRHSSESDIAPRMEMMKHFSEYYGKLLFPKRESSLQLRAALHHLNRLGIRVHYPLTLKIYDAYDSGKVTETEFEGILKTIESYIVRRFFHSMPTNPLNRLFASLCSLDAKKGMLSRLSSELSEKEPWSTQYWPHDDEFRKDILRVPIYDVNPNRCHLILEAIESSFRHPEETDLEKLTVEHVMPEKLSDQWSRYLGPQAEEIHRKYGDTLGNLTLIAGPPNSSLSNRLFSVKKKKWYSRSHVELTKELARDWKEWTETDIERRARKIADRALKIWQRPSSHKHR